MEYCSPTTYRLSVTEVNTQGLCGIRRSSFGLRTRRGIRTGEEYEAESHSLRIGRLISSVFGFVVRTEREVETWVI